MSRKVKNIIMITIIFIVCIASGFTIKLAKEKWRIFINNIKWKRNIKNKINRRFLHYIIRR